MKIIKCDRCGKEFPAIHYCEDRMFRITMNENRSYIGDDIDLCEDCEKELIPWLANSRGLKGEDQNDREDS